MTITQFIDAPGGEPLLASMHGAGVPINIALLYVRVIFSSARSRTYNKCRKSLFGERGGNVMKILVFMGSPRKNGCTATLLKPFLAELENNGAEVSTISLYDKKISPCLECYKCQNVLGEYGCSIKDDMYYISNELLEADCFILASPIFFWYCTAPMKAMLDRFYGLHKYYGEQRGSSLLEGKKCGIIATCGYDLEYGISPFEDGIKRFCEHFKIEYIGKAAVQRNAGDGVKRFETDSSKKIAIDFANIVSGYCFK